MPHPFTLKDALQRLVEHREIFHDEMIQLMRMIASGEMSPIAISALLLGLRVKKETIGEITAAAQVLRELCIQVHIEDKTHLVDIVGTGGDGANTFNISTCAMFVASAAGAKVSKNGGRGVSSKSGSADVLESLGVNIHLPPDLIARCIQEIGLGFMFGPNHHPAMKNVAPIRRELGIKTIFNILGPLVNPASAPNILMGVFHSDLVGIQTRALQRLGTENALVVHGCDGLDEVSLGAATLVGQLKNGTITEYEIHPSDFGFTTANHHLLRVQTPEDSKTILLDILNNKNDTATLKAATDIVIFNAGVALYAAQVSSDIAQGIGLARQAIESGQALVKLNKLVHFSQQFKS